MKKQPELNNLTPCDDIEALFFSACEEEEDIERVVFENLTLEGGSYPGLTFRQCRFVGCHITGCALERAAFIDCVLEHCDFSNTQMPKGTLQRTWLSDCKLLGVTLAESFCSTPYLKRVPFATATSPPPRYGMCASSRAI